LTGADVDTWGDVAVNPNMVAIDGMFCGVQQIAVTNVNVTLTSPAGFTPTPAPGPTQSQNRVLQFTGAQSGNVLVTLPLPGVYTIENNTTGSAALLLSFRGATAATEVISIQQGMRATIYNDGSNVRFTDQGSVGELKLWSSATGPPFWVMGCTVPPYLLCDGAVYTFSQFGALGRWLGSAFGGNGITTFGVPDLRGRYPLSYDSTGTRVTVAASGIAGQTIGAAQDLQNVILTLAQIPSHFHAAGIFDPQHSHIYVQPASTGNTGGGGAFGNSPQGANTGLSSTGVRVNSSNGIDTTYSAGGGLGHVNMPNTQVVGIWVIKT